MDKANYGSYSNFSKQLTEPLSAGEKTVRRQAHAVGTFTVSFRFFQAFAFLWNSYGEGNARDMLSRVMGC